MGLTLVTGPTSDPVTLAEAKAHCRITVTDEDALLAGYLLAARHHAETYTRRALATQTWDLTIDYDWPCYRDRYGERPRIVLPRPPLQSVSSITYVDLLGATQTLATSQYLTKKLDIGEWAIEPAHSVTWPDVRCQLAAITVRFVAGYGDQPGSVPDELRQAMLLLIGHWFNQRETVNVGTIVNELPFATRALLDHFRVF